jgi:t-SNARE complex subunit (syntaxin)
VIEGLIDRIKTIAIKTSALIYEQGQQLNIAASTMKSVKTKLGEAKNELVEGNKYQQNTNKHKLFMCLLVVVVVIIIMMIIIASRK